MKYPLVESGLTHVPYGRWAWFMQAIAIAAGLEVNNEVDGGTMWSAARKPPAPS
jgi:hypothetical protein